MTEYLLLVGVPVLGFVAITGALRLLAPVADWMDRRYPAEIVRSASWRLEPGDLDNNERDES